MSKTAPIVLTLVLAFSILGYVAIDSNSNNAEDSSDNTFTCDDGDCDGFGETWGPGIGPPPAGCEGGQGGQGGQSEISIIDNWSFDPMILLIIGLCGATAWSLRGK